MKKLLTAFTLLLIFACDSDKTKTTTTEISNTPHKTSVVNTFLKNPEALADFEHPIQRFKEEATKKASTIIDFNKDNLGSILKEASGSAKTYVFLVADHTLVKLTDINNTKRSGSWGLAMPLVSGYIKKKTEGMVYQEDYMNQLIGIPDGQTRIVYIFD